MSTFIRSARALLAAVAAVMLCACASGPIGEARHGPGSEFVDVDLKKYVEQQSTVLDLLKAHAAAVKVDSKATDNVTEWDGVIDAGMNYADNKCRNYLDRLYMLDRDRRTLNTQIGLIATATAGVMAAAKSAAKEVAIVAILFGLTTTTIDNLASNVLYELPPSTVQSVVDDQQRAFRGALERGYKNWPAALTVIQRYALLCVPSHIENQINIAVQATKPKTTPGSATRGQPPEVSNVLGVSSGAFGVDDDAIRLRGWAYPNGTESPVNVKALNDYLAAKEPGLSVMALLNIKANADARARAVAALKIP
jgi:hypothetical protein